VEDERVYRLLQLGGARLIVLDDDYVLTARRETLGEIGADRSGAHDDYSHLVALAMRTDASG
jgi:hypothetical protein